MRKLLLADKPKPWKITPDKFELTPFERGLTMIKPLLNFISKNKLDGQVFICGGYMRYCASQCPTTALPDDIDIYFFSEDALKVFIEEFQKKYSKDVFWYYSYDSEVNGAAKERVFQPTLWGKKENAEIIPSCVIRPRSINDPVFIAPFPLNLIHPQLLRGDNVQEIIDDFDFTICRAGYYGDEEILVDTAFHYGEEKRLLYVRNGDNPLSTMQRVIRYSHKGYDIEPRELLRLLNLWNGIEKVPKIIQRAERIVKVYGKAFDKKEAEKQIEAARVNVNKKISVSNLGISLTGSMS